MADVRCNGCKVVFDQSDMSRHDCPESDGARIERLERDVRVLTELAHGLWARVNVLEGRDEYEGMP